MRWLTLIVALMLGACGTLDNVPTQAELQAQWDALNVFPQRYKSDILSLMRNYLNDPTNVRDAGITQPQLKKVGPGDRYVVCVRFNARNSDRKYTGAKEGAAVFAGAKLDHFVDLPKEAKPICKDVSYEPFPELAKLTR